MEKLLGKKCLGFKFENRYGYIKIIDKYIGQIGEITYVDDKSVAITFNDGKYWFYPPAEVHKHLVTEEIPTLGEGKLMLVSDDENHWIEVIVFYKHNGKYYAKMSKESIYFFSYDYAKEITAEVTMQEIADKFNININDLKII